MPHDVLANIWFVLWCVIWTAYFIFDSYTLGIGMLFPFTAKDRQERNQLQEIVGPFWNGAEVWLITAGGATFAAFPAVYADMFSLLYIPFFLVLFSLIFRAAGLEFMHKDDNPLWVSFFKWAFVISSFLISFILGVLFSNLYYGLPIGENGMEGSIFDLFHMYALLGGVLFVALFLTAGSLWINVKAEGEITDRSYKIVRWTAPIITAVLGIYYVATASKTPIFDNFNDYPILYAIPILSIVVSALAILFVFKKRLGLALTMLATTILLFSTTGFAGMYPNMLPSKLNDALTLTLYNSASSQKTLQIMFIVALIFVPIVLAYQVWAQFLFKKKVTKSEAKGY